MYAPNTAVPLLFQALDASGDPVTGLSTITVKVFRTDGQVWDWTAGAFSATPSDPTETLAEISAGNAPGYYYVSWPGSAAGDYFAEFTPPEGQTVSDQPIVETIAVRDYSTATALATAQADLDDIQTRLPAALVGGRIDASVGAMATGTLTADALAADAATEIAAAVWATAETGSAGTFGYGLTLLRKNLTNRLEVTASGTGTQTLYDDDATTAILTWTLRDGTGSAITTPTGSPALRGEAT